jgi:hypothetical protein
LSLPTSTANRLQLNSNIFQFIIFVYHVDLKDDLLSPIVFARLNSLDVNGQLDSIQDDLFKDFQKLRIIDFAISNLKEFFHLGNKWMTYLNLNVSKLKQGEELKKKLLILTMN